MLGLPLDQQARGQDFRAAYEAEYGASPEAYDSYAYDAAAIFVQAVLEAGPTRAESSARCAVSSTTA
jgi:ABC-type branched-subunit amino acid transport system substrate-binding protein